MLDFLLGTVLIGLAIRGWWRGLLREAISLVVLAVGLVVAFRLSSPVGDVVEALAGVSPEVGRLIGGAVIFLGISIGAGIASSILHKGMRFVPGLPTLNRAAGAGFAIVATLVVATLALSLLAVTSPPDAVTDQIEGSSFAELLTDPDGVPQKAMGVVSGDRVLERLLALRELTGAQRLVADEDVIVLEPSDAEELEFDMTAEEELLDMVNRERASVGEDPLVLSGTLRAIAAAHAEDVYTSGIFGRVSGDGLSLDDRLEAAALPVVSADQIMALAVSAEAAQEALFSDGTQVAILRSSAFRRVGIAAVNGPLGVIVVEVFAG